MVLTDLFDLKLKGGHLSLTRECLLPPMGSKTEVVMKLVRPGNVHERCEEHDTDYSFRRRLSLAEVWSGDLGPVARFLASATGWI